MNSINQARAHLVAATVRWRLGRPAEARDSARKAVELLQLTQIPESALLRCATELVSAVEAGQTAA